MVDFASLRKNSSSSLDKLTKEIEKLNTKSEGAADIRFWYPNVDKAGNGYAVIRFLPTPGDEEVPFVRMFKHAFKGPAGQWYIENSLTTIGQPDPLSEYNGKLWNSTTDDKSPEREQVREQKRRLLYISNIYIITDQLNPENEGKVKLFNYGAKIFDKLNEAMNPQFEDEKAINPFDLWDGANFKLKIRNVEGYRNYDKSEFSKTGPLFDSDEQMEVIWKQEHSLQAFLAETNFKTYDELSKRLDLVLGLKTGSKVASKASNDDDDTPPAAVARKPKARSAKVEATSNNDDDDDLEFFKKLSA
jgi:hypothetical protein